MEDQTNEFEDMNLDEDAPEAEFDNVSNNESLIDGKTPGEVYNWEDAPDKAKAPPRVDMDGMTVTINKADIVIPSERIPWTTPRNKSPNVYKACTFVLHYDYEGQQEFYSGTKVFKTDKGKYSHPTIADDEKSQVSALKGKYARFKNKSIKEVALKEFMAFLNSKPKAIIKVVEVENPKDGSKVRKNLISEFVN